MTTMSITFRASACKTLHRLMIDQRMTWTFNGKVVVLQVEVNLLLQNEQPLKHQQILIGTHCDMVLSMIQTGITYFKATGVYLPR